MGLILLRCVLYANVTWWQSVAPVIGCWVTSSGSVDRIAHSQSGAFFIFPKLHIHPLTSLFLKLRVVYPYFLPKPFGFHSSLSLQYTTGGTHLPKEWPLTFKRWPCEDCFQPCVTLTSDSIHLDRQKLKHWILMTKWCEILHLFKYCTSEGHEPYLSTSILCNFILLLHYKL